MSSLRPRTIDIAAVGGGAAVGGAAVLLGAPLAIAAGSAVAAWGALRFLVLQPLGGRRMVADGLYDTDVSDIIGDATRRIARIRELGHRITSNPSVRQQVLAICSVLDGMMVHFREDPGDVVKAQRFLAVYLDRTVSIIERYVEYEDMPTEKAALLRHKVANELLPELHRLCEEQYERFLDEDLSDYETDVEVLKKTIRLENL